MFSAVLIGILIIFLAVFAPRTVSSRNPCSCHRCGRYVKFPAMFCTECRPVRKDFKPAAGPKIPPMKKQNCKCPGCERKRNGWPGYQPCASKSSGKVMPPPKQR